MNTKTKKGHSFIFMCITYFFISFLIIVGIFVFVYYSIDSRLASEFPNIETLLVYKDRLLDDDYEAVPDKKTEKCFFVIFNENGEILYKNKPEAEKNISFSKVQEIPEYDDTFITIDVDVEKVDGKELVYEKYSYTNNYDEKRILVVFSPNVTYEEYLKAEKDLRSMWIIFVIGTFLTILLLSFSFTKRMKKTISAINKNMSAYTNNGIEHFDNVPSEFQTLVDNYKDLIKRIEKSHIEKEVMYKENQRIITNISHDIKTPLTIIQGYSKAFIDGKIPQGQEEHYIQTIFNKAQLSNELVDAMFDYIRMDHPSFELKLERVDFCEVIRDFLGQKYCEIENHGFQLKLNIMDDPIYLWLDKKQFGRVLENLINNSLKYNEQGTMLYISLQKKNDDVVLIIADNGVGIDDAIKNDMFKPFVTSNNSRLAGKGTGLGLSIVKKIIELHNGTITLAPKEHSRYSTEFIITLKG